MGIWKRIQINSQMKKFREWGIGKETELQCTPSVLLFPDSHMFNYTAANQHPLLFGCYGSFFIEAWLIKSLATGDLFSHQPLFSPQKSQCRTESFNFLFLLASPGNQPPTIFKGFPKVNSLTNSGVVERHLWITRHSFHR